MSSLIEQAVSSARRQQRLMSPPSSVALLQYTLDPRQAFVGQPTTLTMTVANQTGGSITMKAGRQGDEILVIFPAPPNSSGQTALTDNVDFTATMLSPGFRADSTGLGSNTFAVSPTSDQTLTPGQSIQVSFGPINVNQSVGTATVAIQEYIGASEGSASIDVNKIPAALQVIAWLNPWIVGLGVPGTLFWQSSGGTRVQVSGFPDGTGSKTFPVSGSPPFNNSTPVTVLSNEAQRTYTLVVTTNDGQSSPPVPVTLTQHSPWLTTVVTTPATLPNPLDPSATIQLDWTSLYAAQVFLGTPQGQQLQVPANPSSPFTLTPGVDAVRAALRPDQIPGTITYTLQATGYASTDSRSLPVTLGQMGVLYLKVRADGPRRPSLGVLVQDQGLVESRGRGHRRPVARHPDRVPAGRRQDRPLPRAR